MDKGMPGKGRKPGRPPAKDKADRRVVVRLTSAQEADAEALAKHQGYPTPAAMLKAWLIDALAGAVGNDHRSAQ